jgi:uncharacterized protein (DUF427 family)
MATKLSQVLFAAFPDLRYQPTAKRIRALAGGSAVVDTRNALLVWEPKRITPVYAVSDGDLQAELEPASLSGDVPEFGVKVMLDAPPALDPRTGFAKHTTAGEEFDVIVPAGRLVRAAFRPADPDLAGYVVLDFGAFRWLEDDEDIIGHPRDPFHRVDIRASSLPVEIKLDGVTLASTTKAQLLYETMLPVRYYIPPADVRLDLMESSTKRTVCPYKGTASYWSYPHADDGGDVAWAYDDCLPDAAQIHGLVCFFNERADLFVDGVPQERPVTPWSRRPASS